LDPSHPTLGEEEDLYLNAQAINAILRGISDHVLEKISSFECAHMVWMELQDIYGNPIESHHSPTSQGNDKVKDDDSLPLDELMPIITNVVSVIMNVDCIDASLKDQVECLYGIICMRRMEDSKILM
jgi:hypothetical protein